jgi:hypothetical protein
MNVESVVMKIARLRRGGKPRVLDLFAGCGGYRWDFTRRDLSRGRHKPDGTAFLARRLSKRGRAGSPNADQGGVRGSVPNATWSRVPVHVTRGAGV